MKLRKNINEETAFICRENKTTRKRYHNLIISLQMRGILKNQRAVFFNYQREVCDRIRNFLITVSWLYNNIKYKNNIKMGNSSTDGVPNFLAKNWQIVPTHSNLFRNKLTHQYAHRYILDIEDNSQLQSFKIRMKESNPYICRVLFYHQYDESIYHVYTEQMGQNIDPANYRRSSHGSRFQESQADKWARAKIGIFQAFWILAQNFGFIRICRQMIGFDGNGNWKVWIHPDPCAHKPWGSADTESEMLHSLKQVIQQIQQEQNTSQQNPHHHKQHPINSNFTQTIESMILKLQQHQQRKANIKSDINKAGSYIDPPMQISINLDLQNKHKKEQTLQKLFNPVVCETSRDDEDAQVFQECQNRGVYGKIGTTRDRPISYYYGNKYHEINSVIQAEAARRRGSDTVKSTKLFGFNGRFLDTSANREKYTSTHFTRANASHTIQQSAEHKKKSYNLTPKYNEKTPLHNLLRNHPKTPKPEPQSLHHPQNKVTTGNQIKHPTPKQYWEIDAKSPTFRTIDEEEKRFSQNRVKHQNQSLGASSQNIVVESNKIRPFSEKEDELSENGYKVTLNQSSREPDLANRAPIKCKKSASYEEEGIPFYSDIKNTNLNRKNTHNQSSAFEGGLQNNPNSNLLTTERFKNIRQKLTSSNTNTNNNKTLFQFYCNKYNSPNKNNFSISNAVKDKNKASLKNQIKKPIKQTRQRKNTKQMLKDELSGVLDAKIADKNKSDCEILRNNLKYKEEVSEHDNTQELIEQSQEKDETEMIRQKVQKKKATFAHLKMEVMKMLQS